MTHVGRLPTLAELGNIAAFIASDQSSPMTGAVVNLSGGAIVD
jgi:enoyl-[acyl-carrier-protein] reductase (NADH)